MLDRFPPPHLDNAYRGHRLALWCFGLLVLMKTAIACNSIFNGHMVAATADGIPLDTFTPGGAQTVVSMFAVWGLAQLVICLVGVLVLVRYRTMLPLMFSLLLFEHLARRLVFRLLPIPRTGTPPGSAVNLVLVSLMVIGLALSLRGREQPSPQA